MPFCLRPEILEKHFKQARSGEEGHNSTPEPAFNKVEQNKAIL